MNGVNVPASIRAAVKSATHNLIVSEQFALGKVSEAVLTDQYYELVSTIFRHVFNDCHDSITYNRRLIITGVGKNANIAAKISETMASLGIPSFYLNTAHAPHGDFGFIGPHDALIHISRSGTTQEMLGVIGHVKLIRPEVLQVLVHCNPSAPNSGADIDFCIGKITEGDEHKLAPTSSTTALLCFLDAVAVSISTIIGFGRMDFLNLHPAGALGKMLAAEKEASGS